MHQFARHWPETQFKDIETGYNMFFLQEITTTTKTQSKSVED